MSDPLIVSAVLVADAQDDLDARRRRYFPAARLQVGAHLTLFHALPGEREADVAAALERLTAQDARPWRPHVTIQNKVDPHEARRTLADVQAGHAPYDALVEALALWRYRGGPWEAAGEFAFG